MNIQWYPGHMTKARRKMIENAKKVDGVLEIIDARIPISSRNPDFDNIFNNKARFIVLNKSDLSDSFYTREWISYFRINNIMACDITSTRKNDKKKLIQFIEKSMSAKIEANKKRGIKKNVKLMVVGIPNSGKSTVINLLAPSASAKTGNRPGVTKGQQIIRISPSIVLLDTPGVLWPKFEDDRVAINLALTGAIREQVLDTWQLAVHLVQKTPERVKSLIAQRYKIDSLPVEGAAAIEAIAKARGFVMRGNELDVDRCAQMLITEFKNGKWGKLSLEVVADLTDKESLKDKEIDE